MSSPIEDFLNEDDSKEIGHSNSKEDLNTPDDDDQVEPGAKPWTEEDDNDAKSGPS